MALSLSVSSLARSARVALLCAAAAALVPSAACRRSEQNLVRVDGSSTVYPLTEAVAETFPHQQPDTQVTVGISGTGGGFKKFCAGELEMADASRPIEASERELCKKNGIAYIELPVAYDGIAVVVNPQNDWASSITVEELRQLWEPQAQGKITRWSQLRAGWPDREIHLFGPGVDSGTYDYFTEVIVGKEHASRGDYTSSEDDNVLVQGVSSDPLALGFFGFAYYNENRERLQLVPVQADDQAQPVAPSPETIRTGAYHPLSRPLFVYPARSALDQPHVLGFVNFYLAQAARLAPEVGYVPLPERAYELARQRVEERRTGSLFAEGRRAGMSIEELLEREQQGTGSAGD